MGVGVGLFAVSAYLASAEVGPSVVLATSVAERFEEFSRGSAALPIAETSRERQIRECYSTNQTIYARAQSTTDRNASLRSCETMALSVVSRAPTVALGWSVAAAFAGELGDREAFNSDLAVSQEVAPYEQWLAEFRVALIEQDGSLASKALRSVEDHDLAILVKSNRGVASLAARYVEQPDFRERVTEIVEKLAVSDQNRFLAEVQSAAAQVEGHGDS
jgi:hypothetical protein